MSSAVILPDLQMPYQDRRVLVRVLDFVGDYQPDEVVQVGDLLDLPYLTGPGKANRFRTYAYEDAAYARRRFLQPLRKVYDGPVGVIEGNHDALSRQKFGVDFSELLDFDSYGITRLPDFYAIEPGWLVAHGHIGTKVRTSTAGGNSLAIAKAKGCSVIGGHSHKLASITEDGLTGVEVGHLIDPDLAKMVKSGSYGWKQGFAILAGSEITLVPIGRRSFVVDGETYKI